MRESRCIICGETKNGLEVKDDYVIEAIRWVKRNVTKSEKGSKLVVCKEDFVKYKKARDSYKRKQTIYLSLGVIFTALLGAVSGSRIFLAVLMGLGVIVFMYLLSLLSYMPDVSIPNIKESGFLKKTKA